MTRMSRAEMILIDEKTGNEIGRTDGVRWMEGGLKDGETRYIQSKRGRTAKIDGPCSKVGIVENFSNSVSNDPVIMQLRETVRRLTDSNNELKKQVELAETIAAQANKLTATMVHLNGGSIVITDSDINPDRTFEKTSGPDYITLTTSEEF